MLLTNFSFSSSIEILKYMDDVLYNYFNNLFEENLLKDTSVFLLNDYGTGITSIYLLDDFFQIEMRLPMLFILINDRKNVTYESQYKYLNNNQQTFITGFDIYNTKIHIITKYYKKLFNRNNKLK